MGYPLHNYETTIAINWNHKGHPLATARESIEIHGNPKGHPSQNVYNQWKPVELLKGPPCKMYGNQWTSIEILKGLLATYIGIDGNPWKPSWYPLQHGRQILDPHWNPKGCPSQNTWTSMETIEIIMGTPCNTYQNLWKSMDILRGTNCTWKSIEFSWDLRVPFASVNQGRHYGNPLES